MTFDIFCLLQFIYRLTVIPRDAGSGSGGYLEYVMRHAAIDLFSITEPVLTYRVLRNKVLCS